MRREHPERRGSGRSRPGGAASRPNDRKSLQLCRQAERALHFALAELADPVFESLQVEAVHLTDDERLCVELALDPLDPSLTVEEALAHLDGARGFLRAAIAAAIHRRRTPPLELVVRPADMEGRDG